ncbi:hypothetical protein INS49_001560 [Diaporthe citri]|uniref:uncharacterized protein n=1 Tax=Diaporthe citri TaxID=83186 RepID=UPI001C8137E0|nr:uncharacterized protein INS49_001560 [Diaporthe citri]KAG6367371.1 hypothetical protein INS49_001560 [Diaporthe citri]
MPHWRQRHAKSRSAERRTVGDRSRPASNRPQLSASENGNTSETSSMKSTERVPDHQSSSKAWTGTAVTNRIKVSLTFPRQRPRLDVSGSDAPSPEGPVSTAGVAFNPPAGAENVGGSDADDELEKSDKLDKVDSPDEDGEADASDNPSATFWGVRYVSKKYLVEQGFMGVGIYSAMYRRKTTDALYFLSNLGERIWLTDENGDGVLAQDQDMDQTTKSSSDEADP